MRASRLCEIGVVRVKFLSGRLPRCVFTAGLFTLGLSLLAGCGGGPSFPPPVPVSGKVTVRGQPLTGGTIHFVPTDATKALPGHATIESDGTFDATTKMPGDGLIPGDYTVFFDEPAGEDGGEKSSTPPSTIPVKYLAPGTSGVKKTIEESGGDLEINLE